MPRRFGGFAVSPSTRIVTYVSRGFESMRGFDIFMRVAKRYYRVFPDVYSSRSAAIGFAMVAIRSTFGIQRFASTSWPRMTTIRASSSSRAR